MTLCPALKEVAVLADCLAVDLVASGIKQFAQMSRIV
ncbi:hypothetical protein FHS39_000222 [Streptomyces olivoverticillatus]|uniref:Uncharacterized protein n=1 Tax=Streptomyces olivoverticillatus TaxID=66427 RepID=A0A7W7LJ78_9ACTN|nr:hypothetical protein [Streptomyces olivoverticillatus]